MFREAGGNPFVAPKKSGGSTSDLVRGVLGPAGKVVLRKIERRTVVSRQKSHRVDALTESAAESGERRALEVAHRFFQKAEDCVNWLDEEEESIEWCNACQRMAVQYQRAKLFSKANTYLQEAQFWIQGFGYESQTLKTLEGTEKEMGLSVERWTRDLWNLSLRRLNVAASQSDWDFAPHLIQERVKAGLEVRSLIDEMESRIATLVEGGGLRHEKIRALQWLLRVKSIAGDDVELLKQTVMDFFVDEQGANIVVDRRFPSSEDQLKKECAIAFLYTKDLANALRIKDAIIHDDFIKYACCDMVEFLMTTGEFETANRVILEMQSIMEQGEYRLKVITEQVKRGLMEGAERSLEQMYMVSLVNNRSYERFRGEGVREVIAGYARSRSVDAVARLMKEYRVFLKEDLKIWGYVLLAYKDRPEDVERYLVQAMRDVLNIPGWNGMADILSVVAENDTLCQRVYEYARDQRPPFTEAERVGMSSAMLESRARQGLEIHNASVLVSRDLDVWEPRTEQESASKKAKERVLQMWIAKSGDVSMLEYVLGTLTASESNDTVFIAELQTILCRRYVARGSFDLVARLLDDPEENRMEDDQMQEILGMVIDVSVATQDERRIEAFREVAVRNQLEPAFLRMMADTYARRAADLALQG